METYSTFATVTWQLTPLPSLISIVVMRYEILVLNDSYQRTQNVVDDRNIRRHEVSISNLFPETVYVFQVRAVASQDGKGPWSKPKVGITLPIRRFLCCNKFVLCLYWTIPYLLFIHRVEQIKKPLCNVIMYYVYIYVYISSLQSVCRSFL